MSGLSVEMMPMIWRTKSTISVGKSSSSELFSLKRCRYTCNREPDDSEGGESYRKVEELGVEVHFIIIKWSSSASASFSGQG